VLRASTVGVKRVELCVALSDNVAKSNKFSVSNSDLQFLIALAVAVLFGVLGVAGVIPPWFAVLTLLATMLVASWALWRSQWLAGRTLLLRGVIVLAFAIVFCSASYPAVAKLIKEHTESTVPTANQKAQDCSSNVDGNGNNVSVNCDDKGKK
jgi:hypothetical protein